MPDMPLEEMSDREKEQMRQRVEATFGREAVQQLARFLAGVMDSGGGSEAPGPPTS